MKKLIPIIALVASSIFYAMNLDDTARKHIAVLQEKYPTLSPIGKTDTTGTIHAYYFKDLGKTRALVARNDGTYERPHLHQYRAMEIHNPDLTESEYKGFLEGWERHVSLGLCIKLPLDKNS